MTVDTDRAEWQTDPVGFWERQAGRLSWSRAWDRGLDEDRAPFFRWFPGGRLNAAENCLDVHVARGRGDTAALLFDSPETGTRRRYTYRELRDEVARFAGVLSGLGLGTGDRVLLYLPAIPETVVAMLACARLGITHSVVPPVAVPILRDRIDNARPAAILTASYGFEASEPVPYKAVLDAALEQARHHPRSCVVLQRPERRCATVPGRDLDWAGLMAEAADGNPVQVESGHPLYLLYTSGSTAKPKAVARDTGGYLTALRWAVENVFGAGPGDVFWTDSHPGWVMGHSFTVYGALVAGCTTIIYEGSPVDTPDAGTFARIIADHGVRVLFTTPMTLRRIRRAAGTDPAAVPAGTLRAVFLASERVEDELMSWTQRFFGCPVVDNWWQTETGWPIASNCLGSGLSPIKPGSVARPLPGYGVEIVDRYGDHVPVGTRGHIVIRLPLPPGCLQTLWGDDDRFRSTYLARFPGYYDTSDAGHVDGDGYLWVAGRTDDIINVGGDSLSGLDLEQVLSTHPEVERCGVVAAPDAFFTEVPVAFIVRADGGGPAAASGGPRLGHPELAAELAELVEARVGAWTRLRRFIFLDALPRTASAKIQRSALRAMLMTGAQGAAGRPTARDVGPVPLADVSVPARDEAPSGREPCRSLSGAAVTGLLQP